MTAWVRAGCGAAILAAGACAVQRPQSLVPPPAEHPLRLVPASGRADSAMMFLAHLWSGTEGPARCGRTPPPREVMWFHGGRYCELLSSARGHIGFRIDAGGLIRVLTWNRRTDSRAHARSVADSLDVALQRRALTARGCRPDSPNRGDLPGMLWESKGMVVHLSWVTPLDERPELLVIAVDDPKEYPFFLCRPFDQARLID